jgi:hypothetical protein
MAARNKALGVVVAVQGSEPTHHAVTGQLSYVEEQDFSFAYMIEPKSLAGGEGYIAHSHY